MTVDGESELVWEEGERRRARADRRRSLARAGSREYVRRERTRAVELVAIVEDRLGKAGPALACTISRLGRLERHVFGTGQSAREIAETLREIAQWLDELED